jgi:serine phosphatase RsbU (regulator of sigma subunit)
VLAFCCFKVSPAQQHAIDSLKTIISSSKSDTIKISAMNELSRAHWRNYSFDTARSIAADAIVLCKKALLPYPDSDSTKLKIRNSILNREARAYLTTAYTYADQENYQQAVKNFTQVLNIYLQTGDKKGAAAQYNNIGITNQLLGNYPESIRNHLASLHIKESTGDKRGQGISYSNMGAVYGLMENYTDALSCFKSALIFSKAADDKDGMGDAYQGLGNIYAYRGDTNAALQNYASAITIYTETQNLANLGKVYVDLSDIYIDRNEIDKALENLFAGLKIFEESEDQQNIALTCGNLGALYSKTGNYTEAMKYLNRSYDLALKIGDKTDLKASAKSLSELYYHNGDYKKAYDYYKTFSLYKDSLFGEDKNKEIGKLQAKGEYDKMQAIADAEHKKEIEKTVEVGKANSEKLTTIITAIAIGLILVAVFSIFLYNRFRITKKQKQIIELKNNETQMQKLMIEEKQKEIIDSINYAKRIQYALLAHTQLLTDHLDEHFLLFRPKDIVSGDFYWATSVAGSSEQGVGSELFYLAVCDSTGHGVPGAFMSLLNISYLNEAILEKNILEPNLILNHVRKRLIESVSQDGGQDGMDAILICYDKTTRRLTYSAAYNSPLLIRDGVLTALSTDKMPVGKGEKIDSFTLHTLDVQQGDCIYLYTDGYADQFGGPKGKKFKYKQLNDLLLKNIHLPMNEQKEELSLSLDVWKGDHEQVDDICAVGIRF